MIALFEFCMDLLPVGAIKGLTLETYKSVGRQGHVEFHVSLDLVTLE